MTRRRLILALLTLIALAASLSLSGCERSEPSRPEGPLRIVVSVPPLKSVAERLAPDDSIITVWTPLGASPHGYEPTPDRVKALVQADVVLLVGAGLDDAAARLLDVRPRPWRRVVTLASFAAQSAAASHDHNHDHGHAHGDVDPHLWLDVDVMRDSAPALREAIASGLTGVGRMSDATGGRLTGAEQALLADIDAVDQAYTGALAPAAGTGAIALHGGVTTLLERYGLEVVVAIDGHHVEPSPTQIADAAAALREGRASIIVKDPATPAGLAERLAEQSGAPAALLDLVGDEDWFALMRGNLNSLVNALEAAEALDDQPPPSSPAGSTGGGM